MGNACMGKKSKPIEVQEPVKNIQNKKIPKTDLLITSTPPIETPDMSVYIQTVNNQTPKSEYSRRSSARLNPIKRDFRSSFDNQISNISYSFVQSIFEEDIRSDGKSFKIHGTDISEERSDIFKSLQNQSIPSFNAISKNDLLLMTEENVEILNYLTQNQSGPYYFNDGNLSKTDLNFSSKKYIFKKNQKTQSIFIKRE